MPRLFTMATLISRCKQRVGMENGGAVDNDAEWRRLISTKWARLYGTVVETGCRYFESKQTYTTDGSASYDEPADHWATLGVFRVYSDGRKAPLFERMPQERHLYAGQTGEAVCYEHVDDQIYLFPTPASGQTYELIYTAQPADLSDYADAQTVDVVTPDGEAFLIEGVAVQALSKEESDVSVARQLEAEALDRVQWWAIQRALVQTRRRHVEDAPDDYPAYPGDYTWYR